MRPVVEPTPPAAYLTHARRIGPHALFVLSAPPFDVDCQTSGFEDSLKLIAPRVGSVLIKQNARTVALEPGQVALVSLKSAFRFRSVTPNQELGDMVQWRLPREVVTQRHPGWHGETPRAIGDGSSGERVLAELLSAFVRNCSSLSQQETAACFSTLVEALGLLTPAREPNAEEERVRRALLTIQRRFHDPALTPQIVADDQRISRRYLDDLLKRHGKGSLSATIRSTRLDRAAQCLREQAGLKLLTLALSLGFENQSHFSRRFKERFGVTPSQFRNS